MEKLLSPENFDFAARYLLAGLILIAVRSRYVVGERPKLGERFVEAVILSLFNQAIFQLLLWIDATTLQLAPWLDRGLFFAEVMALPAVLGLVSGLSVSRGWEGSILRTLAMPVLHPIRRGHDFAFTDRSRRFLIVTYQDGSRIHGYFGDKSLAASDANRSDMFLELLYDVKEDGTWIVTSPPKSCLLNLKDVKSIEFIPE